MIAIDGDVLARNEEALPLHLERRERRVFLIGPLDQQLAGLEAEQRGGVELAGLGILREEDRATARRRRKFLEHDHHEMRVASSRVAPHAQLAVRFDVQDLEPLCHFAATPSAWLRSCASAGSAATP